MKGSTTEPFFRRLDWSAFWTAGILAFVVYLWTLAPTVTLEDSGEFAVAADSLGVPHPPGYPIWTMISWVFTRLFSFVTFRGQPNPAWSVGLSSAVFGGLAAGISAMLICRSGSQILKTSRHRLHNVGPETENTISWLGGVVSSLLFAFSPVMWSQSVIIEAYSLNAFFLVLVFLLTYQWMYRPGNRLLYVTAFVFGLGLTNYQVLLLAALPLAFVIFLRDIKLFRDFTLAGLPFLIVIFLIRRWSDLPTPVPTIESFSDMMGALIEHRALPPIIHPLHVTGYVYFAGNGIVLALAWLLLPHGRTVALTMLMAQVGVAFYAYMPIVSDLRNPPMNWGYPRTWEGFQHAITRGQYERIKPADVLSPRFLDQVGSYLVDLRDQFTLLVAWLGFLPFTAWRMRIGKRNLRALYLAIALGGIASAIIVAQAVLAEFGLHRAAGVRIDKLPLVGLIALAMLGGSAVFVSQTEEMIDRLRGKTNADTSERVTLGLCLLGLAAMLIGYVVILATRIVRITEPLRQAGAAIEGDALNAILAQVAGLAFVMVLPFALGALTIWLRRGRTAFRMTVDRNTEKWIIATLLGFLTMSILLIALANPKGDIQDTFIQRVKFISSHALYAFWIGYGLIFGMAVVDTLFRERRLLKWVSTAAVAILPLVPLVYLNQFDRDILHKFGGAEQGGHDFGWQFGNYQLRGAEAIQEELDPDEEPIPNPAYPRAMAPNAIFFGGTDPGRFVPTYMIYGARVREDVYLITQNALADNTYMSVMRDLYGDQIWIPAQPDSARAFQRYVEEVQAGKRPRNAQLVIRDGRVQVSGALGVMEINGILAQMIFEHNRFRHAFYVEESYVIPWMYPHLEPHGLIMKIKQEPVTLHEPIRINDTEFWDWFSRRLIDNRKFRRDVVARKSFSKLRSAIAGLYANRGHMDEAEDAYQQARTLYPLSPEATFRLSQEVLLRQGRIQETRALLKAFGQQDPNNDKVDSFLANLDEIEARTEKMRALEADMQAGKLDLSRAMDLADLYHAAGRHQHFRQVIAGIRQNPGLNPPMKFQLARLLHSKKAYKDMAEVLGEFMAELPPQTPPEIFLSVARMYANAGMTDAMAGALEAYLNRKPDDWRAWVDMTVLRMGQQRRDEALQALQQAVQRGGQDARTLIERDTRLSPLLKAIDARTRQTLNIPGLMPAPRP